ncbi:MAG: hypothetical protein C4527_10745 [Candidatus Omnitrophota bacterium]|nr:MAG: hypothetical protein C4527_10745 [Candidatus Omnitrophota bacterium]
MTILRFFRKTTIITMCLLATADPLFAMNADTPPFTCLFDTTTSSAAPLSGDQLNQREGWILAPEEETEFECKGDTVFLNNKIAVALRKSASAIEFYSKTTQGFVPRAAIAPESAEHAHQISAIQILENNTNAVAVAVSFTNDERIKLTFRVALGLGQPFVHTKPLDAVEKLTIQSVSRFAVLPDFFASDIVIDARQLAVSKADLPSENLLLQYLGNGEAILITVCNQMEQDISIVLNEREEQKFITETQIHYGEDGEIWIAVLDTPDIWHTIPIAEKDAGRIIDLDWNIPFPAQWRVDWQCANNVTDSWEMLVQQPDGTYFKYGWMGIPASFGQEDWLRKTTRERWTTVLGFFPYPCWIDKKGKGHLQPLKKNVVQFVGPVLMYPINRVRETPLDQLTIVDIVRETLGVGPCEYVLDIEGQKSSYKGIATCDAKAKLDAIYSKGLQKHNKKQVQQHLDDVLAFMRHIRGRIQDYADFGQEMQDYLEQQKKSHPECIQFLDEMKDLLKGIDRYISNRQEKIHTPEYAEKLVQDFRDALIDSTADDAYQQCQKITAGFVEIGGNQDELVGECRMVVKLLRQRAGLETTVNPAVSEIAQEIRNRTQQILRNPVSYEAPQH